MPLLDDIQYGFVAGEVSPKLRGRADLEKYDLGLTTARNFFIDPRGGLCTRPGTIFVDYVMHDDKPTKFFPFKFAPALESTYNMLFGDKYIRFIQDGAYVVEPEKVITGMTAANPAVVTSAAHGYANGDWIKLYDINGPFTLNQQTFVVAGVTTNTFQLKDTFGNNVDTSALPAFVSGGAYRIYTVVTTYNAEDLELLRAHQSRSQITLTHNNYKPRALIRVSDTNWTLTNVVFGNGMAVPSGVTITPSTAGTAGMGVVVTAVDKDGNESLPSNYVFSTTAANTATSNTVTNKITWTAVAGAVKYRVYRTRILPVANDVTRSMELAFVGEAFGPEFIDTYSILPDFSQTPPMYFNPFADGAIEFIQVTAPGTGYSRTSVVSASVGTEFQGQVVVNQAGQLLGIVVIRGGSGYTGSTVISVTGGTGATVNVTLTPAAGNNPAVSSVFQQRKIYAATQNDPLTIWGSKPKAFETFDFSNIPASDDAYEFELDSDEVAPIRHLLPTRQGLTMMTQAGVWRLSSSDGIVRATNALADPESYVGCSLVPPLVVDTDIVYVEQKGQTVRQMTYSDYQKLYLAQDLSILSSHLMTSAKPIRAWAYASDPYKLVHAVRADGALLTMTLLKEQNVYAWTQNWTKGLYLDVLAIQEGSVDAVYYMVQRYINGRWTKFIERAAVREFAHVEEAWAVDCGLSNGVTMPDAILVPGAASGNGVNFTATAAVFTPDDVGSVLRIGGGMAKITGYTSSTVLVGSIIRPITEVIQEDPNSIPVEAAPGLWTLDKPLSSVGGLGHLEGQLVSILADGAVLPPRVVVGGKVNLEIPATRIIVGLGFRAIAQTLPINSPDAVIEDKAKRIVRTAMRLNESRGVKTGTSLDYLTELKERTDERYGEATLAKSGLRVETVEDVFDYDNCMFYVQDYPLPLTVLGLINKIEVSEDK